MGFVRKKLGIDLTGNEAVRTAARQQRAGYEAGYGQVIPMLEQQVQPFQGMMQQLVDFSNPQAQADYAMNNPLLRFMADEAQRRVFGSQAASGKLGSTATATSLQNALVGQGMDAVRNRQAELFGLAQMGMQPQNQLMDAILNRELGKAGISATSTMAQQANTGALIGQAGRLTGQLFGGPAGEQMAAQRTAGVGGSSMPLQLPSPF